MAGDVLKQVNEDLKEQVREKKEAAREEERLGAFALIADDMVEKLTGAFQDLRVPVPEIKVEPKAEVNIPEIKLPVINVPEAKVVVEMPKIPPIKIPKIDTPKIPPIKVPTPKVTVNVPKVEMPDMPKVEMPDKMKAEVTNDRGNPIPMTPVDLEGKPMSFSGGSSGGTRIGKSSILDASGEMINPATAENQFIDPALEMARGNVPGLSVINKFGRNDTIASGTTEDIWDGSALYSFPATALMTSISQTTDQVAMRGATIEVQGLDANWDLVVQDATLNASNTTTVVTLTTPLIRVFRMKVQAAVVGDSTIRVHNAGETQDYATITTGNNQTLMAIYTVPNGKTAYMTRWYATVNPATNLDPTSMAVRLWAKDNDNGYERQLKHVEGITEGQHIHTYYPYKKFTQKSDIYIDASPAGKAADVSAGFDLILVDN